MVYYYIRTKSSLWQVLFWPTAGIFRMLLILIFTLVASGQHTPCFWYFLSVHNHHYKNPQQNFLCLSVWCINEFAALLMPNCICGYILQRKFVLLYQLEINFTAVACFKMTITKGETHETYFMWKRGELRSIQSIKTPGDESLYRFNRTGVIFLPKYQSA